MHHALTRVPDPGVEYPEGLVGPHLRRVVEAAGEHLLAERHHVRRAVLIGFKLIFTPIM